jgi:hypothetical protein
LVAESAVTTPLSAKEIQAIYSAGSSGLCGLAQLVGVDDSPRRGQRVAAGVFQIRVTVGASVAVRKVVMIR